MLRIISIRMSHRNVRVLPFILGLMIFLTGCNLPVRGMPSLDETQIAVAVQLTQIAAQSAQGTPSEGDLVQATINAQATAISQQATQIVQGAPQFPVASTQEPQLQATLIPPTETPPQASIILPSDTPAQQIVNVPPSETSISPMANTQVPVETPLIAITPLSQFSSADFESFLKSASILLYEDMGAYPETFRFVKKTLDSMGLNYMDVGSAQGWLKSQLLSGGPNGQGWDLIIIAAEAKAGVTGEFYEYVNTALNQGSSVIMESWYLDQTAEGTAGTLLARCGIEFQADWTRVPPNMQVMYPLDYSHPILQTPNSGLTFTDVTSFWGWNYDIGDFVKKTFNSDATLIIGTIATDKSTHGTVTVCENGQLIWQTFSSHQLTYDVMRPLWENYIYNALMARYQAIQ